MNRGRVLNRRRVLNRGRVLNWRRSSRRRRRGQEARGYPDVKANCFDVKSPNGVNSEICQKRRAEGDR